MWFGKISSYSSSEPPFGFAGISPVKSVADTAFSSSIKSAERLAANRFDFLVFPVCLYFFKKNHLGNSVPEAAEDYLTIYFLILKTSPSMMV